MYAYVCMHVDVRGRTVYIYVYIKHLADETKSIKLLRDRRPTKIDLE